jgi:FixJ family two-component response regulator
VDTILRALRLGVVDICLKPVVPQMLHPLVDRTLARDAALHRQQQQVAAARRQLANLTPRERQLFELLVKGRSHREMASTMGISPRTVEHHRAHITAKLGMDRVAEMVRLGLLAGADAPDRVQAPI